jgi:predicted AlkP superfamily phosphohydrolase/phosphomutase
MGPLHHASWNIQDILDRLGYGKQSPAAAVASDSRASINPWRVLKMVMPGRLQYAIKNRLPKRLQDELLFRWYAGDRDWQGCRAFAVPNNDSVGAIRVNVRGRDPNGMVEPGTEYQTVCHDIASALEELKDPSTGRSVISRVTITHRDFHGPYLENLPDITVLWDSSFAWNTIHSPRFGTLRIRRQDGRSGSHTSHGFILAKGPGIPADCEVTGHSIYDIAPTILDWAGVEPSSDMDGKPIIHVSVPAYARTGRHASAVVQ